MTMFFYHVFLHVLPQNDGLIKALNFGLNHRQHPIIFRMDITDLYQSERISVHLIYGEGF